MRFDSLCGLVVASTLVANKNEVLCDRLASFHQDVAAATACQIPATPTRPAPNVCVKYNPCVRGRFRNDFESFGGHEAPRYGVILRRVYRPEFA